jgi:hypothetical protein
MIPTQEQLTLPLLYENGPMRAHDDAEPPNIRGTGPSHRPCKGFAIGCYL